jgi:hypothetical protein
MMKRDSSVAGSGLEVAAVVNGKEEVVVVVMAVVGVSVVIVDPKSNGFV